MSSLYQLTCAQMLLYGVMWTAAWTILGDERRAVLHWLAFSLLLGAGLGFISLRPDGDPWLTVVVANLLLLLSVVALWRGSAIFLGLPLRDREHILLVVAVLAVAWMLGPVPRPGFWRHPGFVVSAAIAWVMAAAAWRSHAALVAQFGPRVAGLALTPHLAFGVLQSLRTVHGLLAPDVAAPMHASHASNLLLVYAMLVAAAVFNLVYLFLIVLRLMGRLTHLVEHDGLTGLLNQRATRKQLEQEWARWRRMGRPFAVVSVDLDHFKQINDRCGHPAGDEVLRFTAAHLKRSVRQVDVVGRVGGEEFLILMPGCGGQAAAHAAERLRLALAASKEVVPGHPDARVTASLGVAVAGSADADLDGLLQRADAALYAAKHAGRDRVVVAPPSVASAPA